MTRSIGKPTQAVGLCLLLAPLSGCVDVQSVMAPQGLEAERIAVLWWVLLVGSSLILLGVGVATALAIYAGAGWRQRIGSHGLVVGGGIVFPIVTLSALLVYGLLVMRAGAAVPGGPEPVRIAVVGERWWWRVIYTDAEGNRFEGANELRIPAGRPVRIELTTADVIHSFWVPKLAGKLDMIPGRTTILTTTATEPGVSRGQCAEYCGGAHALMAFYVVAMPPQEFDRWLERAGGDAPAPTNGQQSRGQELFLQSGCGACHTVRGTEARGTIGPDLTRLGSRRSLAAATLPNTEEALARWIANGQHVKPENAMPEFRIFNEPELSALSQYLASLK